MKKLLATLLLGMALTVAALPAAAQDTGSAVTMTAEAQGAAVSLELPRDTAQGVKAMRLSFAVESAAPVDAEFVFDSALPGSVHQYRYNADTGVLTVYLAGGEELFPQGSAQLGSIRLDADPGSTATVRLVEDSLELVNAAFGRTPVPALGTAAVEVTVDGDTPAPDAPESPAPQPTTQPSSQPSQQPDSQPSGGNSSSSQSGSGTAGQSSPTATPTVTTTPVSTAAPQTVTSSGSAGTGKKPAKGNGGSTAVAEATPNPTEAPQTSPEPVTDADEQPAATQAPATPEQAEPQSASALNLPLVILVVVACLAAVVLIGIAVLRFRSR